MDRKTDFELSSDRNEMYDELYQVDKEKMKRRIELELQQCQDECKWTEIETERVKRMINERTYVLQNLKRRCDDVDKELMQIHENYVQCAEIVCSNNEAGELDRLTKERENLQKLLDESKESNDKNNEELIEINRKIMVQEKKNMALLRRLVKAAQEVHVSSEIKEKINKIINDATIN